jgi:hypothetical protein
MKTATTNVGGDTKQEEEQAVVTLAVAHLQGTVERGTNYKENNIFRAGVDFRDVNDVCVLVHKLHVMMGSIRLFSVKMGLNTFGNTIYNTQVATRGGSRSWGKRGRFTLKFTIHKRGFKNYKISRSTSKNVYK